MAGGRGYDRRAEGRPLGVLGNGGCGDGGAGGQVAMAQDDAVRGISDVEVAGTR